MSKSISSAYPAKSGRALKTGDIDYSEGLQQKIITDEGSCVK